MFLEGIHHVPLNEVKEAVASYLAWQAVFEEDAEIPEIYVGHALAVEEEKKLISIDIRYLMAFALDKLERAQEE